MATLEPLVEACRPHVNVPPSNLRRTVETILWRCTNGAKWRSISADLGPCWKAAQNFIRWARQGVWDRLLALAQKRRVELGVHFLDDTSTRAHAKAAGASKREGLAEAMETVRLRRSLGGYGTKAEVLADASARAVAFRVAPGQDHELPHAVPLLDEAGVRGPGYSSHAFRAHVLSKAGRPAIPVKRHEAVVACPAWIYTNRNPVERLWARLKDWLAVATRDEKTFRSFVGVLCLAATCDWIRR